MKTKYIKYTIVPINIISVLSLVVSNSSLASLCSLEKFEFKVEIPPWNTWKTWVQSMNAH
jgi:hypothetical protein